MAVCRLSYRPLREIYVIDLGGSCTGDLDNCLSFGCGHEVWLPSRLDVNTARRQRGRFGFIIDITPSDIPGPCKNRIDALVRVTMRMYDTAFGKSDSIQIRAVLLTIAYDLSHAQAGDSGIVLPFHLLRRKHYRVTGDFRSGRSGYNQKRTTCDRAKC